MREEIKIGGIDYVLNSFTFGTELEINDRSLSVDVDEQSGKVIATTKPGTVRLLTLLHSLKSWTFRGLDPTTSELVTVAEIPILDITEDTVKMLPSLHGNMLSKRAEIMNNIGGKEGKN